MLLLFIDFIPTMGGKKKISADSGHDLDVGWIEKNVTYRW